MAEAPRATPLLARALELLRAGEGGPELEEVLGQALPAALEARTEGRDLRAEREGTEIHLTGPSLAPARVLIELAPDGTALHVRLDTGGRELPAALAHLPLAVDYDAAALPDEHRFWADTGGLLMVGEFAADSGWR